MCDSQLHSGTECDSVTSLIRIKNPVTAGQEDETEVSRVHPVGPHSLESFM